MQCCDSHDAQYRVPSPGNACGFVARAEQAVVAPGPGPSQAFIINLVHVLGASRWHRASSFSPCPVRLQAAGFSPRLYQQGRCRGNAKHMPKLSTKALRAGVLRRAVSLAAPFAGYTAVAFASTAMRLLSSACPRCAGNTVHPFGGNNNGQRLGSRPAPRQLQMLPPNPSVNRRRHGSAPCPRGAACLSCASRARRPAASPRLPLR